MEENKKECYEAPEVVIVRIKPEGRVLMASQDDYGDEWAI